MNILLSCIGRRGYIAQWFREHLDEGSRIIGTSNTEWTSGFSACDAGFIMPDIRGDSYIPTLLALCEAQRIDAILSFHDLDVDAIARHRDEFIASGVKPVIPSARVSRIGLDKLATRDFLHQAAIAHPQTFSDLTKARAAIREGRVRFPLIVKHRFGFGSQDLFVAHNDQELAAWFGRSPHMLIQEFMAGQEHSIDVLNDLDGRVVSVVVKRKILMRAGETDQAISIKNDAALKLGEKIGAALGHVGPLDVDLFIDGDALSVLELNPRFGGAYACSHLAGADFPRKILSMLRGENVDPDIGSYDEGVPMMKDYLIVSPALSALTDLRRPES